MFIVHYNPNMQCPQQIQKLVKPPVCVTQKEQASNKRVKPVCKKISIPGGFSAIKQLKCPGEIKSMDQMATLALHNQTLIKLDKNTNTNIKNNKSNTQPSTHQTIEYGCITSQVVAGINTMFAIKADGKYYTTTVWSKLDGSYNVTSFKAAANSAKTKTTKTTKTIKTTKTTKTTTSQNTAQIKSQIKAQVKTQAKT